MRWTHTTAPRAHVEHLAKALGVSRPTACLLHRLGVSEAEGAQFLRPALRSLGDPFAVTHMAEAVARVRAAIDASRDILIFGDYDVDGVTSTVFLLDVMRRLGVRPRFAVPRRLEEGYGLSMAALDRVLDGRLPGLVICLDCGTNSVAEVAWLRARGVDVVILDHHQSKTELPDGAVIVNPHLFDEEGAPWRDLCTVGLVFKFVHALLKQLRAEGDDLALHVDLKSYLDLVALGTVADLVPLTGENRVLTRKGLELLRVTRRAGLGALFEVSGMALGSPVTPFDIAFRLSPRINACGRLADASAPIELLMSDDWTQCRQVARQLDDFNNQRQAIERGITEQAEALVETQYAGAPALVLAGEGWHPGVVGIVAARIAGKYHRPTLVFGSEGTLLKGSGRSVPGVSLVEALTPCAALLESWGGHPMAVGVSLAAARIDALREAFCHSVTACGRASDSDPCLDLACWLDAGELRDSLFDELELVGPFGQGNPEPIFGIGGVTLSQKAVGFGNGHCRFHLELGGRRVQCIAWKQGDSPPPPRTPLDLAVRLTWNVWNEQRMPQLHLEAWRKAGR